MRDHCAPVMDDIAVMDRAYERRQQLLAEDDVMGVAMTLEPFGVTLIIAHRSGGREVEFIPKEVNA